MDLKSAYVRKLDHQKRGFLCITGVFVGWCIIFPSFLVLFFLSWLALFPCSGKVAHPHLSKKNRHKKKQTTDLCTRPGRGRSVKLIEMQRCQGLFSVDSQSGRLVLNVACEKVLRRHDATSAEQKRQIGEHRSPSEQPVWWRRSQMSGGGGEEWWGGGGEGRVGTWGVSGMCLSQALR